MRFHLLIPEVRELLQDGKREDLLSVLQDMHPTDAASILSALSVDEIATVLAMLPPDQERDVFGYLEPDVQEQYVAGAGRERVKNVLRLMLSDDRAAFLDRLDPRVRDQLIPMLPNAAREDLLRRGTFREDQVGSFLSTDYAVLNPLLTARSAIAELRRQAPSKETIYYSYVLDRFGKLLGFVSLRDLILANETTPVGEIMKTDLVSLSAEADQEEAARIIRDYDLIALPIVDTLGRLVGIVTHDDAVDIVEEEANEDFEKMVGVTGESIGEEHLHDPIGRQIRRRAPVIAVLAVFWLVTATVISGFEKMLQDGLLVATMPMVMAIGGMVGSQASTLIVRALSTGSLGKSFYRVLLREGLVSLGLAALLAAIAFANALFLQWWMQGNVRDTNATMHVASVIGLAMAADVVFAAILGASIPNLVRILRIDPALVSTPAVTALTDLTGASIYLVLVTLLL
ncbi:MAG TPA: magnesium transporter [Planctomycetota bacterium]|nr:magnesium transporter [Planctomycetota bacterium]